ncbi:MAG: PD-(D/E)XK nuclease domain-containing protein [Treponema sp.]|nr:PD-(D/E)XK nuclease domain-containing protein [Treponema sp.]
MFGFKRDSNADEALSQIESSDYEDPYKADERELIKIGVNFDSAKSNITEWKVLR